MIRFYQKFISPLFPPTCRFTPTCSTYFIQALEKYGIFKGDIIISIDNENITQMTRLQEKLKYYEAGTSVEIVVLRQEKGEYKEKKLQVELGLKK